jgi:hypothetical protein
MLRMAYIVRIGVAAYPADDWQGAVARMLEMLTRYPGATKEAVKAIGECARAVQAAPKDVTPWRHVITIRGVSVTASITARASAG